MLPSRKQFVENLSAALLSGEWRLPVLLRRVRRALPSPARSRKKWVKPLVQRVFARFPQPPRDDQLTHFLEQDEQFLAAWAKQPLALGERFSLPPRMWPPTVPLLGEPPSLRTTAELADWLGLLPERLDWYANLCGINSEQRVERLRHYEYKWLPKPGPNPAKKHRLLEAPKPGLKRVQRQILWRILNLLPPHDAAHGFRLGRSIVSNAAPHCSRAVVLRFDLTDFFPSIPVTKVRQVFRAVGYPQPVANLLAGLCTTRLPADVWDARPHPAADGSDHFTGVRLKMRHLPQGVPTSPALVNLCAFGLDVRLAALAAELDATYTRYADDLTISGGEELAAAAHRVRKLVAMIAADEGFALNFRKSRVLRRGVRQTVAGVVVNVRPNLPRAEFDRLKAILTNCVRTRSAAQNLGDVANFRAHLAGRISHAAVVNPARGRKLWTIFDRINWPQSSPSACPT